MTIVLLAAGTRGDGRPDAGWLGVERTSLTTNHTARAMYCWLAVNSLRTWARSRSAKLSVISRVLADSLKNSGPGGR